MTKTSSKRQSIITWGLDKYGHFNNIIVIQWDFIDFKVFKI